MHRFEAANTQVMGISVDSIHSHANWAAGLGGVSFPLLADFHPKGEMARSYGTYLEEAGITDRATVIIDADGIVRHASSVSPKGKRDAAELAGLCEEIDNANGVELVEPQQAQGLRQGGTTLYVKDGCGPSRSVLLARENLHIQDAVTVRNVSQDSAAMEELLERAGKEQAPCLIMDGEPMLESAEIVRRLVTRQTGFWA